MAKALVSEGARVFVTGRDRDRVNKTLAELRSLPVAHVDHSSYDIFFDRDSFAPNSP